VEDDEYDIMGLKLMIFIALVRDGNLENALELLQKYIVAISRTESSNPDLYFESARLFSRLSGRNHPILNLTIELIERARKRKTFECSYAIELAYQ